MMKEMNDMEILIVVLVAVAICLMYSGIIACVVAALRNAEEKNDTDYKRMIYSTPLNYEEDMKILDSIIDDEFTQYEIMHLAHRDNLYINSEEQERIITEVLGKVIYRISDDLVQKLSLYYKSEYINDIIFNKIKLVVINYTVQINGNYKK